MFNSSKKIAALIIMTVMTITSASFYFLQNSGVWHGGNIALVKLLWLTIIIFLWYVAPLLLIVDHNQNQLSKKIISLHLANVMARAIIELFMMYGTNSWHPYYGISHDIFSFLLLSVLLLCYSKNIANITKQLLMVLCITFVIEAGFAYYMLNNVVNNAGPVYFVPAAEQFNMILSITWLVVICLSFYIIKFFKKWMSYAA